ncbi:MAG: hypothetical protein H8D45_09615 [Bacteroidetes bacterium]|nr:hypothetical protein [Bacteroidota bacterium]
MKKIISILTGLLMAIISGVLFASVLGVSPFFTVGTLIVLGSIPLRCTGILMFNFANLTWADGEENMGGLQVIGYYALIADIDNFPALPSNPATAAEEVTLEQSPGFIMLAGKYFYKIYSTLETSEVVDENQGEWDGQSFVHKGEIFYPGTKAEALAFAKHINNSNMVFIFLEADGTRRVIGSEAFPAKCKPSFTTGKATADRKGMTLEIQSYGYTPAPFYEGVIRLDGEQVS